MVHAFRHEHVHAHVEARDNKLDFIHNLPKAALDAAAAKDNVKTVYSQVTITKGASAAPASTPGPTGNGGAKAQLSAEQASYQSAKSLADATQQTSNPTYVTTPTQRTRTPVSSSIHTRATWDPEPSSAGGALVGTPQQTTRGPSAVVGTPISATNGAISEKSSGMSGGAKAGLAFGIILAIALAGGLVFFCWRRRKQQLENGGAHQLDEKRVTQDSFFGGTTAAAARGPQRSSIQSEKSFHSSRTAATAPRLSLRPVTQFLPNILGGERAAHTGNNLDVPAMSEKSRSNPFDDPAAAQSNPFEDGDGKNTPNHSQKNSWGSEPPTPKSTKFGTAAAVAITSAGAPNGAQMPRGPNNVHRVQLDFKPSMEDELELRSGQLVRMVHEYDDGWALCMRLDRSQQGVCPRTCLSKLPVKPRPQGPPPQNGPSGRPMGPPPQGMRRPASPQVGGNVMLPRPLTPNGRERSNTGGRNSPAPHASAGRPRSQSMSGMGDMPLRKPVPGMAL